MGFGDFTDICTKTALPLCPLVGHNAITGGTGIQPACYPRTISLANTIIFQGAASFVHIGALIMALIMIFHVRSKFTAVGRKEITTVFYIYVVLTIFSLLLDAGVVPPGSKAEPWFVAVQLGLASALCLSLCINGFIGFQVYEDGTTLSVWLLRGLSAIWGGIVFLIAILTFKSIGGLSPTNTVGIFIVSYVFNALLLAIYVIMQVLLVLGTLQEWFWPIGTIVFGVFCFTLGQVLLYSLSETICDTAQHYLDGLFFATITNLLGIMMVYKFWDSITTEDLEFSVGTKVGGWDVKEAQPMLPGDDYDGSTLPGNNSARASKIYQFNSGEFSRSSLGLPLAPVQTPPLHQRTSYMKGTPSPSREHRYA